MKPGRRELPIIFTAESVRAILAGAKTQTRRLAKFAPLDGANLSFSGLSVGHFCTGHPETGWVLYSSGRGGVWQQRTEPLFSRFLPGDVLWVKEAWVTYSDKKDIEEVYYRADDDAPAQLWGCDVTNGGYPESCRGMDCDLCQPFRVRWRSPLYMPRWASRISLEVTEVRAQRVQAITEEDAIAEGYAGSEVETPREQFAAAWDRINGKRSPWSRDDFVFAYTFRRIEK